MTTSAAAKGYLSIPQLARRIGCGHSTLYADIKAGRFAFPVVRIGADLRVPLEAVDRFERGQVSDEAALRAEVAGYRAEVAALREAYRQLGAALAAIFDTPATCPTASLRPVLESEEKSHEEGLCRDALSRQPVAGRIAQPSIRAGGNQSRPDATRGVRRAARPHGDGGQSRDRAPLSAAGKTKRSHAGERVVG